jgi:nitronate monooxygenase
MERWVEEALQEGIRFFVTSLGKPDWVVKMVHPMGGKVYHDVTERRWAEKGVQAGVDGLTAVNGRSGGHAGIHTAESLLNQVRDFGLPVVCAGGIGKEADFVRALDLGYDGVQMGTRFLATPECQSSPSYKKALLEAGEEDIVLTERLTGIPVHLLTISATSSSVTTSRRNEPSAWAWWRAARACSRWASSSRRVP